jgi:acyl-CoA reductase-like NAD-dependent aldehyde dehydrogenase
VPYATKDDLDEALAASERAWPEWRSTDVEKRGAILHKTAALLRERADAIARTMTQEQGKPVGEAKLETLASAQLFDWYAEEAKRDYGRTLVRPAGQLSRVIRQPVGPTATFTPWNFPIYLLAKKVSAALAAGCTVISRPPHETPGVATELFRALADPLLRPARHLRRLREGFRRAHPKGEGRQRAGGRREDGPTRQQPPPGRDRNAGPGRQGQGRASSRRRRARGRRLLLPADFARRCSQ